MVSIPASPTVFLHGLAPACLFRLRRRRISLHDSTNIAIFGEKTKCEDFWRCRRIFIVKLSIIRIVNIMH